MYIYRPSSLSGPEFWYPSLFPVLQYVLEYLYYLDAVRTVDMRVGCLSLTVGDCQSFLRDPDIAVWVSSSLQWWMWHVCVAFPQLRTGLSICLQFWRSWIQEGSLELVRHYDHQTFLEPVTSLIIWHHFLSSFYRPALLIWGAWLQNQPSFTSTCHGDTWQMACCQSTCYRPVAPSKSLREDYKLVAGATRHSFTLRYDDSDLCKLFQIYPRVFSSSGTGFARSNVGVSCLLLNFVLLVALHWY